MMIISLIVSALWTAGATTLFSFGRRIVQEDLVSGSVWITLALAMFILEVCLWSKFVERQRA
ncbi:MAG: hypothetical protein RBT34_09955 [Anaerolineaceae bacterium]|jgi:hypothetical protein|nr:hypothetical protein [Anaerolineaceae bacterium]